MPHPTDRRDPLQVGAALGAQTCVPFHAVLLRAAHWAARPLGRLDGWERLGWSAMLVLLVVCCPLAVGRAVRGSGSDLRWFYVAGQHVVQQGVRMPDSKLHRYLPSSDVACVALTWMPLPVAALAWYAMNCGSWFGLLGAIRRYALPAADLTTARQATLCAGLLTLPLALDGFCLGTFHVLMVYLMVVGLARASRGQPWTGGILLGLAVWVKLLPLLGVVYLLLKHRWLPAATALVVVLVVDLVLSIAAFGLPGAWQAHRDWLQRDALGATSRQLQAAEVVNEDRLTNQSLTVVLRRVLTTHGDGVAAARRHVALADLSSQQLTACFAILSGLLLLGLVYFLRRPGRCLSASAWAVEIALVLLSTVWLSPVVWGYHPTAATPALAIILWQRRYQWPAWILAGLWLGSMALLGSDLWRALGGMLWITLAAGFMLLWVTRPSGRAGVGQPVRLLGHGQ